MKTIKESLQSLTDEQLRGAEWAFRYVMTSPALRGKIRADVHNCVVEVREVMTERNALNPPAKTKRQKAAATCPVCKGKGYTGCEIGDYGCSRCGGSGRVAAAPRPSLTVPRTKAEVLADRRGVIGCCESYANRMSCSCLEDAVGTTGCGVCHDPNCKHPNKKH